MKRLRQGVLLPAFHLIGREGLPCRPVPGKMHAGDGRATKVETGGDLLRKAPAK